MADRILLNATKGKPKSLSICNKELRNVPPIIGKITSLKSVDLKNNVLTDLPSEFSSLKQVITSRQSSDLFTVSTGKKYDSALEPFCGFNEFFLNCWIPLHLFACHWIRIASIVSCFVLKRTPTNENNSGTEWRGIQQLLLNFSLLWEFSLTLNFLVIFCFTSLNLWTLETTSSKFFRKSSLSCLACRDCTCSTTNWASLIQLFSVSKLN